MCRKCAYETMLQDWDTIIEGSANVAAGTQDFFIAASNHSDWGTSHLVWGEVDSMKPVVNNILSHNFTEFKHPEFGTIMRMLVTPVPFTPLLLDDVSSKNSSVRAQI